jgi:HK97 family phage major capsid protein
MELTHYDSIVQKHAQLSDLVAKLAAENRAPSDAEKQSLETLKAEIAAIKANWESEGRKAFLGGLHQQQERKPLLNTQDSLCEHIKGSYPEEFNRLSLGRLLRGWIAGSWDGAELEQKAMTSSPTTAGGILIPAVLSARIIDRARNLARVFQAGAVTVPMTSNNLTMARNTQDVTAGWYSPNTSITESDMAFDAVTFTARKLAALVRIENELLEDASNVDAVVEESIGAAIALELDRVALLGTGTAPQPKGLLNVSGVNTVTAVGTPADYDKFLTAIYAVRKQNFEANAAIYSARTAETLAKLKTGLTGDKTPLAAPADWSALSRLVSNQVPDNLGAGNESAAFVGQFDQLMIGLRRNILLEVSREASDVFPKDQTLIRATWRGDVQVAQPKAFCVLSGITA